eukprot:COSAG02_NODE_8749_length_2456_cov_16.335596_2_plen_115_part_00
MLVVAAAVVVAAAAVVVVAAATGVVEKLSAGPPLLLFCRCRIAAVCATCSRMGSSPYGLSRERGWADRRPTVDTGGLFVALGQFNFLGIRMRVCLRWRFSTTSLQGYPWLGLDT